MQRKLLMLELPSLFRWEDNSGSKALQQLILSTLDICLLWLYLCSETAS